MDLGVKVIHCAERDTQVAEPRKRRFEFVNTWSVDGFIGEGSPDRADALVWALTELMLEGPTYTLANLG